MDSPRPIRAQKSRGLEEDVRTFARKAIAATSRTTFCRMSPNAVRKKPRCTKTDIKTCTHTSVQIAIVHFRPSCDAEVPTPELYVSQW